MHGYVGCEALARNKQATGCDFWWACTDRLVVFIADLLFSPVRLYNFFFPQSSLSERCGPVETNGTLIAVAMKEKVESAHRFGTGSFQAVCIACTNLDSGPSVKILRQLKVKRTVRFDAVEEAKSVCQSTARCWRRPKPLSNSSSRSIRLGFSLKAADAIIWFPFYSWQGQEADS